MLALLLRRVFPSIFDRPMNRYTVVFTCQRGRGNNFRSVYAETPAAARAEVMRTTPTLGEVVEVREFVGH